MKRFANSRIHSFDGSTSRSLLAGARGVICWTGLQFDVSAISALDDTVRGGRPQDRTTWKGDKMRIRNQTRASRSVSSLAALAAVAALIGAAHTSPVHGVGGVDETRVTAAGEPKPKGPVEIPK